MAAQRWLTTTAAIQPIQTRRSLNQELYRLESGAIRPTRKFFGMYVMFQCVVSHQQDLPAIPIINIYYLFINYLFIYMKTLIIYMIITEYFE